MSLRFKFVNMLDRRVRSLLPMVCQKKRILMRLTTRETRSENDICEAVKDRLQEQIILFRVILEIGILNYDEIARSSPDSSTQRRPLASIDVVPEIADGQIRVVLPVVKDRLFSIIRGGIIDDHDFLFYAGDQADPPYLLAYVADRRALIVCGYDNG